MKIIGHISNKDTHRLLIEYEDGTRQWFMGTIKEANLKHWDRTMRKIIIEMESEGPPINSINI